MVILRYDNETFEFAAQVGQWRVDSPAPASGWPRSPLSLAGCHLCPDCLGCAEPDSRQPSPPPSPEPEESPRQPCPWFQTGEMLVLNHLLSLKAVLLEERLVPLRVKGPPCAVWWLISLMVMAKLGLIYTSQWPAGNPQETRRKMLLYKGEWGTG